MAPLTRQQIIEIIEAHPDAEFQGEIIHFRDCIDREDDDEIPYDTLSALYDIDERNDCSEGNKRLLRICNQLWVDIGRYRVMTDDEIANTQVSRGTKWCFKINGVPYTDNDDWCERQFVIGEDA